MTFMRECDKRSSWQEVSPYVFCLSSHTLRLSLVRVCDERQETYGECDKRHTECDKRSSWQETYDQKRHTNRAIHTRMNESCHIYEWVMFTHEWVTSRMQMNHVTHMNESYKQKLCAHIIIYVAPIDKVNFPPSSFNPPCSNWRCMHLRGGYQKEIYIHLKRPIPTQKRTLYIKNDVRKETGYMAPEDVVNLPELLVQVGGARDHGGVGFLVIHP